MRLSPGADAGASATRARSSPRPSNSSPYSPIPCPTMHGQTGDLFDETPAPDVPGYLAAFDAWLTT